MKNIIFYLVLILSVCVGNAQQTKYKIHSHNDYQQEVPFWTAYSNNSRSIEIDLVLDKESLYVAHDKKEIHGKRTIESLYLNPLQEAVDLNIGNAKGIYFLIDLKSDANKSMDILLPILDKYSELINKEKIIFVISGNKPDLKRFKHYPEYIKIDHQSLNPLKDIELWKKVAMISLNFKDYSVWNGKGRLVEEDKQKLQKTIDLAHSQGKPIRFWNTPDGKTAWKAFVEMGIDVVNTDKPYQANFYLSKLEKNIYKNTMVSEVYKPTFESDGKDIDIENVILLIGDGNGLTQISATALANKGDLSLLQLKNIGFIKTQSSDDFTTDSAAGGTAFSTGEKTYNRSIGMGINRQPIENITELLSKHGFNSGCITTDEITGATPSVFYAHQKERDDYKLIAKDLLTSKLSLFIGGGRKQFEDLKIDKIFSILSNVNQLENNSAERVGLFLADRSLKGVIDGRSDILSESTKKGIKFLNKKNKPFFLMVEGAKIDTYGHFNNTGGIITEGIDFDKAISESLKFADKNGKTLVIITADHETSGFAIPQGDVEQGIIEGDFISDDHTGTFVPIFAYGPKSNEFRGVYENNEVYHKIIKALNLKK